MENKWLMFKNYMHNELGITKEDIRQWIQESVEQEAKKLVSNEFGRFSPERIVKDMVYDKNFYGSPRLKDDVINEISKQLAERIEIKIS